jgi:hypothetical protein
MLPLLVQKQHMPLESPNPLTTQGLKRIRHPLGLHLALHWFIGRLPRTCFLRTYWISR